MNISPEKPIALFGCGNMGRAMLNGWLAKGTDPAAFTIIDPQATGLPEGITHYGSASACNVRFSSVLLGIKPQMLQALHADVESVLADNGTLLSVLAGIRGETLKTLFPGRNIVRIMPNLAVSIGKAPIGIWTQARRELEPQLDAWLAPLGRPIWIDDEAQMDSVTALAGSGPAFVYRFIDALAKGGVAMGMNSAEAAAMAKAMVAGAAALAEQSTEDPEILAAKVTSPGGTTAAGLAILDRDQALNELIAKTLHAARDRGRELANS
jgi:pyrroline-5-carboxylate reductase